MSDSMWGRIGIRVSCSAKNSSRYSILVMVVCVCLSALSCTVPEEKVVEGMSSTGLGETVIVAAFESPISEGKNVIWCSSFQVAWNELKDGLFEEPILVADAEEACRLLNASRASEGDLEPESYFAAGGIATQQLIDEINGEMAKRFPQHRLPTFNANKQILAYAYLEILLQFSNPYFIEEEGMYFRGSGDDRTRVMGFGVNEDSKDASDVRGQIGVLFFGYSNHEEEFAVDLDADSETYQVVAALVEPKDTLAATYDYVVEKTKEYLDSGATTSFELRDKLAVPEMDWKINHHFSELEGKYFLNDGFEDQFVDTALQTIQFKLNKEGVELKSEAVIKGDMAVGPGYSGRDFVFNKPFIIYIKKRDADTPVFAMWVDNSELLKEHEE